MTHRKLSISLGATLAVAALAGVASAGEKAPRPVIVDLRNARASGSLGTARNSADGVQVIGCSLQAVSGVTGIYLTCHARDANGTGVNCSSTDEGFIKASYAVNGDSAIEFTWDRFFVCTSLSVNNWSSEEPKQP
jgi:hypothetical protein